MFHRIGAAAYKADLKNIISLSEKMNHPERKFPSIHIAGTNGKGSTSHMIASVLQESGYRTGLFTSPHLKDFRERIRINGQMISEKAVTDFVEEYRSHFDAVNPSFFEWTTALAFKYFSDSKVDVAIIETGLGGRLDSTNIITPFLSIITNISYDHMNLLGDTLEKIAGEKAGIIKREVPVVIGEKQPEVWNVFSSRAGEMNALITYASEVYRAEPGEIYSGGRKFNVFRNEKVLYDNLLVGLAGEYQSANICTVLQSLEHLTKYYSNISEATITEGLRNVIQNTGLLGRWQVLGNEPLIIADVGHNAAGIGCVVRQLEAVLNQKSKEKSQKRAVDKMEGSEVRGPGSEVRSPGSEVRGPGSEVRSPRSEVRSPKSEGVVQLHLVFGMVNDKDPSAVLSLLPAHATYYFCKADMPRAMDAKDLKTFAAKFNLHGEYFRSVAEAFQEAKRKASKEDIIFVGGSTFVVAEVL